MALSKEEIKTAYPLPVYNYRVEIGKDTVAFSEVSGLNISYDTTTYKESPGPKDKKGPGPVVKHMPAQGTAANLTLKKGIVPQVSIKTFFDWINSIQTNQIEKKDIYVRLCDEKGEAVISWTVTNVFPTKLDAPTFDATSNDVAIESLELMGDGVLVEKA